MEEVIASQQNLARAQGHVVKAHATYAKALIQYEQATGTLLEKNNIDMPEAVNGEMHRGLRFDKAETPRREMQLNFGNERKSTYARY